MTRAEDIAQRLGAVRQQIAEAAARAHRAPDSVRLVAVSKKMSADDVRAALRAGQRDFGENYAQELRDKRAELATNPDFPEFADAAPAPRWHYIGPLQRNKVKLLAGQVALIHSVADAEIVEEIDRRTAEPDPVAAPQACLIQVNLTGEARKSGVAPDALPALLDRFAVADHVNCVGLMLIPPLATDPNETRRHFAALRVLAEREARVSRPHVDLKELSMGMSGDFVDAIEEGATLVRVGSAIFGERVVR
jgi:pyridoxal phosphate enzyme (YggS family)